MNAATAANAWDRIPPALQRMITLAPTNKQVRALVMARMCQAIPSELTTVEAIKEWINQNPPPKIAPPEATAVSVVIQVGDTEYGTCRYAVSRHGDSTYELDSSDMEELIAEHEGQDVMNIVGAVIDYLQGKAEDDPPDLESSNEYDYSDYDADDHSDYRVRMPRDSVREQVVHYLRSYHPELLPDHIFGGDR